MARGKKASTSVPQADVAAVPDAVVDSIDSYTAAVTEPASEVEANARSTANIGEAIVLAIETAVLEAHALEQPPKPQVINVVGAAIDINAVLAKHLESTANNTGSTKVLLSRSSVVRPVKLVHIIASEMYAKNPDVQRKEVIAACESMGIATHTARTQYQIWHQAMRSDLAVKAAQAAVSPKTVAQSLSRALDKNTAERKARK